MGAWGIKSRESDRGLDMLEAFIGKLFVPDGFQTFDVPQVMKLAREICKKELAGTLVKRTPINLSVARFNWTIFFDNALLLIAECVVEFYQTGELQVDLYDRDTGEFIPKVITEMHITRHNLERLLIALRKVQDPQHPKYESWWEDETRERWLVYIRSQYEELAKHYAKLSEGTGLHDQNE